MKKTAFVIEIIALIGSIIWFIFNPDFEPAITGILIIGSIIATFYINPKEMNNESFSKSNITTKNIENNNKLTRRILFVDDEKFLLVGILKQAGWINTKWIKDVVDLDNNDIKAADIIFIDINGVGKTLYPKDQGLGLAVALKTKYSQKYIVVYSAESQRVHKAYSMVDACLPKDADPYEFIELINDFSKK
jgi:hypothetical protein